MNFSFAAPPSSTPFRLNFQIGQTQPDPVTGQIPSAQINKTGGVDGQGNLNRATITFNTSVQSGDPVYHDLRLWRDTNHNGVSEPSELTGLQTAGLTVIELDYRKSKKIDEHGNRFLFRAKVKDSKGNQLGRWAWDVFLVRQ